ncbi:MAG: hypothetical protein LBV52_03845, partial [Spirochaetaceae bacterium]|nr:hypothetical protein [Spirochaetaceae bacterium]
ISKNYIINIQKEAIERVPNASGGAVSYVSDDNTVYEVHTFAIGESDTVNLGAQKTDSLVFTNKPAAVDVLVVAGGGGGGLSEGSDSQYAWRAGGGGAGGLIYKTGYTLSDGTTFPVKIGNGGAKAESVAGTKGGKGGASQFGADNDSTRLMAPGGGGGGSHGNSKGNAGMAGGSGGGSGNGAASGVENFYYDGSLKAPDNTIAFGHKSGTASYGGSGSGGGGAGAAGSNAAAASTGSSGGVGKNIDIAGSGRWYAGGGAGGAEDIYNIDTNDPNNDLGYGARGGNSGAAGTGNGGSGGGGIEGRNSGGDGGSGIVIIRWEYQH